MSQQLLFAFIVFAIVMFVTPGPNNIMVLSSGLTYGFRRTVPHIAGITIGFAFMVAAVGLGFGPTGQGQSTSTGDSGLALPAGPDGEVCVPLGLTGHPLAPVVTGLSGGEYKSRARAWPDPGGGSRGLTTLFWRSETAAGCSWRRWPGPDRYHR